MLIYKNFFLKGGWEYMVGFIGYGNMGSMLIRKFIEEKALKPQEIIVSTRTKSKLQNLKEIYKDINIAEDNKDLAKRAKYIFICVKQPEVKGVLDEIKDFLDSDRHIISLAGAITIENIEKIFPGQVSKVTPTVLSEINEGVTLIAHNEKVKEENKKYIESLFEKISKVKRITEEDFPFAVEITSCAPGFLSSIFNEFMKSSLKHNKTLREDEVKDMLVYTIYSTAKLIYDRNLGEE
ncbi:pyrroline-5-carboxylate reductase [Dictyoglomus thermophilum]|nr:pyrroline-5-carboxylate reductase [Dictyoglomus thermophilum]